jgi:hypothetical protein
MMTDEFTHIISRTSDQEPFFPGTNPTAEAIEHYVYTMSLINNGYNGTVDITHTEDEFTWKNTFTCSEVAWEQFKDVVAADSKFSAAMTAGHNYGIQNNFTQTVTAIFKDENNNVIDELDNF